VHAGPAKAGHYVRHAHTVRLKPDTTYYVRHAADACGERSIISFPRCLTPDPRARHVVSL